MNVRHTLLIVGLAVALALPVAAQDHGRTIQAILNELKTEQNVQRVEQIDPNKVGDAQLAQLGEAVMDVQFPNERQHAYMDEMMGGEGSRSLEAMHRSIGYSYLSGGGESGWGMMGAGRAGWGMTGPWMMGGYRGFGWGRGIMSAAPGVWILVVLLGAAVVVLAIVLGTRNNRRRDQGLLHEGTCWIGNEEDLAILPLLRQPVEDLIKRVNMKKYSLYAILVFLLAATNFAAAQGMGMMGWGFRGESVV